MKLPAVSQDLKLDIILSVGLLCASGGIGYEFGSGYGFIFLGLSLAALAIAEKLSGHN